MARMTCSCGNVMSNAGFPNTLEGEIKGIFEYKKRNVWECNQCGRLWIDVDDPEVKGCHVSKSYVPEDEKPGELFGVADTIEYENFLNKDIEHHFECVLKLKMFDRDSDEIKFLSIILDKINSFDTSGVFKDISNRFELLKNKV